MGVEFVEPLATVHGHRTIQDKLHPLLTATSCQ